MPQPNIQPVELSDDDDDHHPTAASATTTTNNNNKNIVINLTTPEVVPNNRKRPRSDPKLPIPNYLCFSLDDDDDDPSPPLPKLHNPSSSFTTSFLPQPPTHPLPHSSGDDDELKCMRSDDETKCTAMEKQSEDKDFDIDRWLDLDSECFLFKDSKFNVNAEGERGIGKRTSMKEGENLVDFPVVKDLEKRHSSVAKEDNGAMTATSNATCSEKCPTIGQSTCHRGKRFTRTYDHANGEDDIIQVQPVEDHDHEKENVCLEKGGATSSGNKANAKKKRNIENQAANRKKLREEKILEKKQEKLRKANLKAEAAKQKQLQKELKKLEKYKFSEKDIKALIDDRVLPGSLGGKKPEEGPLLTSFTNKKLSPEITKNTFAKSVVWKMKPPEEISKLSTVKTEINYILLIYDNAEEFCNHANDGSFMRHIATVRKHYPSYTICCLTNKLREQQKYNNNKEAHDWKCPPVEKLFARLTTQFANVHSRHCVDEAEVAEHVVGLTINLAKCYSRKRLTHLSVNANGANVSKDFLDKGLIMKNTWLKALVSIPKVQPRFAVAIWKKYPTMKSLLSVYMDPTKTVDEKELVLEDLPLDNLLNNGERRLGRVCSKRVYRILMAQNGSITTDDVEDGADLSQSQ